MRTSLALALVPFLTACGPGPDHPIGYDGIALALEVHVADPPSSPSSIGLSLDFVPYCQPDVDDQLTKTPPLSFPSQGNLPFDGAAASQRLLVSASRFEDQRPCGGQPPLRFFRPRLGFAEASSALPGIWTTPGRDVAYSQEPSTFLPFGPDGPAVSFPAGYSVLHASCGNGGTIQLAVEPIDQVLEFHRWADGASTTPTWEEETRRLLDTCGLQLPPTDLGTRVGLDEPASMAFSADGTRLLYFVDRGRDDGMLDNSLRTIPVVGGAPIELSVGLGSSLWLPANGDVYVVDGTGVTRRGHLGPDGTAAFQTLPLARPLAVSPDGQWVVFQQPPLAAPSLAIWSSTDGSTRVVGAGTFASWAADSRHLALTTPGVAGPVSIFDVNTAATAMVATGDRAEWLPDGRLAVFAPVASGGDVVIVDVAGAATAHLHFSSALDECVPAGDRLVQLSHRPWTVVTKWITNNETGLLVEDPAAPAPRIAIATDRLVFATPMGYARVDGGVLASARRCLGLYGTACFFELHRVALPAGTDTIVATSPDEPTLAVSPDGRKLAIGTRSGIFVKDLP